MVLTLFQCDACKCKSDTFGPNPKAGEVPRWYNLSVNSVTDSTRAKKTMMLCPACANSAMKVLGVNLENDA